MDLFSVVLTDFYIWFFTMEKVVLRIRKEANFDRTKYTKSFITVAKNGMPIYDPG